MPSDITGTEIIEEDVSTGKRAFRFVHGPIFANVVLADEINRTPPKTQAALLQAMQEHNVTAAGGTYPLPEPFFVLATQNPIEQEGTYPLPEAQLDRFMLELRVGYPSRSEEESIVEQTTGSRKARLEPVLDAEAVRGMQDLVRRIPVSKELIRASVTLARMTRPADAEAPGASSRNSWNGEQDHAPPSTWFSAPRRGRRSRVVPWQTSTMSNGRPRRTPSPGTHQLLRRSGAVASSEDVVQELLSGRRLAS